MRKVLWIVVAVGWAVLGGTCCFGQLVGPDTPSKDEAVNVRVKNTGDQVYRHIWVGNDYRYNVALGELKPGETSRYERFSPDEVRRYSKVGVKIKWRETGRMYGQPEDRAVTERLGAGFYEFQCKNGLEDEPLECEVVTLPAE